MVYDFHTHSFLSDGVLSPIELIRRAMVRGYKVIGLSDHVAFGTTSRALPILVEECARANSQWDIRALVGVELTHVPANLVDEAARNARDWGAEYVVVHGETIVEPVEEGTNMTAVASPFVDVLAHPGLLTPEEAQVAAKNDVFIEVSARKGHSLANGLVARRATEAGARLLLNSDAHAPEDLLTPEMARHIALGTGIDEHEVQTVLEINPLALLERVDQRR